MIPKFISPLISAAIEGYAVLDRASDRKRLLDQAQACVDAFAKTSKPRALMVIRSPAEAKRLLPLLRTGSVVVFLDCVLERCSSEEELLTIWSEAQRASGSISYGPDNRSAYVFTLVIQSWATARLFFDPRIRWVILKAPPQGPLEYRPFGRRSTLLADVRGTVRPPDPTFSLPHLPVPTSHTDPARERPSS